MEKLRQILHPLAIALTLIYFQLNYFLPTLTRGFSKPGHHIIINAIILGIAFGLIGCPGCSLPLAFSLSLWHDRIKKIILPLIIFNACRLVSIFVYSLAGNLGLNIIKSISPKYMFIVSGLIMMAFGIIILKSLSLKTPLSSDKSKIKNINFMYATWGFTLGFPCGIEASGFLIYLWIYPASGAIKILSLFLFSLFAIIPMIVFVYLFFVGIKGASVFLAGFRSYLRNLAFFYLTLTGLLFIIIQFL